MKESNIRKETISSGNDLASINTELLTEELKKEKRRKENIAYIYGVISQFMWAVNNIQIKTMITFFPDTFTLNTIAFYRNLPLIFIGYYFCKKKNIRIHQWNTIERKFWFLVRHFGFYLMIVLWVVMNIFFRVSTCQCIVNCNPVIVLIISSFLLNEKFYPRYIVGVIVCFIGAFLIISNERKPTNINNEINENNENNEMRKLFEFFLRKLQENLEKKGNNVFYGGIAAGTHLLITSFANFGQREIAKEHISGDEQNIWMGVFNCVPAFIVMLAQGKTRLGNIKYILYVMTNAPIFYLANYYNAEALRYISINKLNPITYLTIVFVFILGYFLLGEKVYVTDIIGSVIIIGFQLYNIYVPTTK
jgi:drug/metabolite transporter (DMT)-like permease